LSHPDRPAASLTRRGRVVLPVGGRPPVLESCSLRVLKLSK
jgi:hypothetical protein